MSALAWLVVTAAGVSTAFLATRLRWLTRSGALAAMAVGGAIALGLGLPGLATLLFFFITSSALTRAMRRPATDDPDSDASGRRAGQVLANAGVAAVGAALASAGLEEHGFLVAAGALAAATADTWASEIGRRVGGTTRLISTWTRVEPGTNGGVSWAGTAAGLAGAAALAGISTAAAGRLDLWLPLVAAGFGGMLIDSVAGATLEDRLGWVDNDLVNWLGGMAGGATAIWFPG